jgi:hypothetical protein
MSSGVGGVREPLSDPAEAARFGGGEVFVPHAAKAGAQVGHGLLVFADGSRPPNSYASFSSTSAPT